MNNVYLFLQEIANQLAKLSLQALCRIGGYGTGENETPQNTAVHMSLTAMLTPYMVNQLGSGDVAEVNIKICQFI